MSATAHDEEVPRLPTAEELPCEDGEPFETNRHGLQIDLLVHSLTLHWNDRRDFFVGGNMFLYFSLQQTKKNDFRGPDVFVALETEWRDRKSWVVWEEEKAPDVVVELTSKSTWSEDHGRKKQIYARTLRVPYYFIFDPESGTFEGFRLDPETSRYVEIAPDESGRMACERLGLEVGVWHGEYLGIDAPWLRWYTPGGVPVPTPEEVAAREAERAAREAERAAREAERRVALEARVAELEAQLRALKDQSGG
jgi:Uma2 family endonuclease